MQEASVKKNFIYSTSYQILNVLAPFITAPYISRVIGAEGIGNRNDEYKRSKIFWEIEIISVTTSLLSVLGWLFFILCSSKYKVYYIVLTIGIFASMLDISWFFEGIEQFKLEVIRNSIFKVIGIISLFVFVNSSDDLLLYVFITMISTFLSNLSLWPYMKKYLVIYIAFMHI